MSGFEAPGLDTSLDLGQPTVFQDYPPDRPFINDSYRRDSTKPIKSYPESNRKAVMSALQGLQDKIQRLELDRQSAAQGLHSVTAETERLQARLGTAHYSPTQSPRQNGVTEQSGLPERVSSQPGTHPSPRSRAAATDVSAHTQEVESQLTAAEGRCALLERQLEYMRRMVAPSSPPDSSHASPRLPGAEADMLTYRNKLCDLEREHLKLSATQSIAENKIRELESRLQEEREHRKRIQDRAVQLESASEEQRILELHAPRPSSAKGKKLLRRKSSHKQQRSNSASKHKVTQNRGQSSGSDRVGLPMDHYRLNLKEVPFVVGQSTAASHSVNVNLQRVLAMMKTHNPQLCGAAKKGHIYSKRSSSQRAGSSRSARSATSCRSTAGKLDELMQQLQDEFATMSFEHQELLGQLQESRDEGIRHDLERELDALVARMEVKASQIAQLKHHQRQNKKKRVSTPVSGTVRGARPDTRPDPRPEVSPSAVVTPSYLFSTAAVRARSQASCASSTPPRQQPNKEPSILVLKEMKALQNSLRKDDIQWE